MENLGRRKKVGRARGEKRDGPFKYLTGSGRYGAGPAGTNSRRLRRSRCRVNIALAAPRSAPSCLFSSADASAAKTKKFPAEFSVPRLRDFHKSRIAAGKFTRAVDRPAQHPRISARPAVNLATMHLRKFALTTFIAGSRRRDFVINRTWGA